jgi:uncharacterized protein (DUF433 family)
MEPLKLSVPLPDVLHEIDGDIRVKGHRISLYHIIAAYDEQWIGPEAMVFYYPTLSYDEIQKVFAFYRANQAAVDEYVRKYRAEIDRQRATGKTLDVEELRRRFKAIQAAAANSPEVNGVHAPDRQPTDTHPAGS